MLCTFRTLKLLLSYVEWTTTYMKRSIYILKKKKTLHIPRKLEKCKVIFTTVVSINTMSGNQIKKNSWYVMPILFSFSLSTVLVPYWHKSVRRVYARHTFMYLMSRGQIIHSNSYSIFRHTSFCLLHTIQMKSWSYHVHKKAKHVEFKDTRIHNQDLKCHSSKKKRKSRRPVLIICFTKKII